MRRRMLNKPLSPGKALGKGAAWAPLLIIFMPLILPLVLIYYTGQIMGILTRKPGGGK